MSSTVKSPAAAAASFFFFLPKMPPPLAAAFAKTSTWNRSLRVLSVTNALSPGMYPAPGEPGEPPPTRVGDLASDLDAGNAGSCRGNARRRRHGGTRERQRGGREARATRSRWTRRARRRPPSRGARASRRRRRADGATSPSRRRSEAAGGRARVARKVATSGRTDGSLSIDAPRRRSRPWEAAIRTSRARLTACDFARGVAGVGVGVGTAARARVCSAIRASDVSVSSTFSFFSRDCASGA